MFPKRIELANLPTKIEKLTRLSDELKGPNIYIKRDDQTGTEVSGNKIRKLEYCLKEALDQGADMLITCGGIQSNHCRATAAVGVKHGIKVHLLLVGSEPEWQGNFLMSQLFGATYEFITVEEYADITNRLECEKVKQTNRGHKPYTIPTGASNGIGTFGYYKCMEEIIEQEKELGITFDSIITTVGSGGTMAGLCLYNKLNTLNRQIYGINISADAQYFKNRIIEILREASGYISVEATFERDEIQMIDGYVGDGYALSRNYEIQCIQDLAKQEGIIFDPVYTGKAMYGLIEEIKAGRFCNNKNILFIHTGGLFGVFPKADLFNLS